MTRRPEIDLAEDVALLTFAMMETLAGYDEPRLPGGTRYHLFEGFPGFCDHCAAAGLALHRAFRVLDVDQWLDIVDGFAVVVLRYALNHGIAADAATLAVMAHAAADDAIVLGLASRRRS